MIPISGSSVDLILLSMFISWFLIMSHCLLPCPVILYIMLSERVSLPLDRQIEWKVIILTQSGTRLNGGQAAVLVKLKLFLADLHSKKLSQPSRVFNREPGNSLGFPPMGRFITLDSILCDCQNVCSALQRLSNEMFSLPFCKTLGFGKYPNRITGCMLEALLVFYKSLLVSCPQQQLSSSIQSYFSDRCSCPVSAIPPEGKRGYKSQLTSLRFFQFIFTTGVQLFGVSAHSMVNQGPILVGPEIDLYLPSSPKLYFRLYTPGKHSQLQVHHPFPDLDQVTPHYLASSLKLLQLKNIFSACFWF